MLYVGGDEMNMPDLLAGPKHICRYNIMAIRKWSAETLLESRFVADTVMAILARYGERQRQLGAF